MSFLEHLQLRSLEIPQKRHGQSLVEFPNIDSRKNQNFKMQTEFVLILFPFYQKVNKVVTHTVIIMKKNQEDSPLYEKMFDAWWQAGKIFSQYGRIAQLEVAICGGFKRHYCSLK